ncbi:agmatinase [Pseudomonas sp. 21]|uniref:agmatinase n=1 Tax=unclassified Pseudomonas TaxID=196821 RepID=UPI0005EBE62B|nr:MULTISPECIES: agmatinase [unclassified Pseudomonas]KJJ94634.1 agmatinase [Pseudomonas sp. 21]MBV7586276.1 agmatinase [Pseudomonas sp. PDM33]
MPDSKFKTNFADGAAYDPQKRPRFNEIASFMRAPVAESLDGIDIGLIGVPYDGGTSFKPGARLGPRGVRQQSCLMRTRNHASGIAPFELCTIRDLGDVYLERMYNIEDAHACIEKYYQEVCARNIMPLTVGGDHSITYPIFKALAKNGPIGMVHIDAHTDTWDSLYGSKFFHGAPFRRAVEDGLLDPHRTIQIGIRGSEHSGTPNYSLECGMRVIFIEEFDELGVDGVLQEVRRVVGDGQTYVSFDVDGLDPAFAPGTGTPEAGGISMREAMRLIKGLKGLNLIGGDVVEVAPDLDPSGMTALNAATLMFEMLCVLADARVK